MTEPRNFQADFLEPALAGLHKNAAQRVALALDAAIAFGVLEYADGNHSLQNIEAVRRRYGDLVERLSEMNPSDY